MSSAAALYFAALAAGIAQREHATRFGGADGRPPAAACACFLAAGFACLMLRGA
ncbi:hypothetical protein [Methylorubrum suomiense]|uniref:hypothetical protein n=1 Tax=Methylorubrum suomiense TaxID=144191 RepID=UPI001EE24318|nr:hypothetical protein [Methylorubrum suomiense]